MAKRRTQLRMERNGQGQVRAKRLASQSASPSNDSRRSTRLCMKMFSNTSRRRVFCQLL